MNAHEIRTAVFRNMRITANALSQLSLCRDLLSKQTRDWNLRHYHVILRQAVIKFGIPGIWRI